MQRADVAVFGEVLFDLFPNGARVLGGAPFNIAWHLQAFGQAPRFISRVGNDAEGRQIIAAMREWGMNTDAIQVDNDLPTGRVTVSLDNGQPSYDIVHPCAYDAIGDPGTAREGLLYHGSLALRDAASRVAFEALRGGDGPRVFFDVNLRAPWWGREALLAWLQRADWVKLNDEELCLLGPTGDSDDQAIEALFERDGLTGLIVTFGGRGATLMTRDDGLVRVRPARQISVVDTVGAGDAFAAVCLVGILQGWPCREMVERAQGFASVVVGQQGATCADKSLYAPFIADWGL